MPARTPMKSFQSTIALFAVPMAGISVTGIAFAHGDGAYAHGAGKYKCPVGVLPNSPGDPETTLNMEFGQWRSNLTRCLDQRHDVKLLVHIKRSQSARRCWGGRTNFPVRDSSGELVREDRHRLPDRRLSGIDVEWLETVRESGREPVPDMTLGSTQEG